MANEHVLTAVNNLRRAVEDMHQKQVELRNDIENQKRMTAQAINDMKGRIAQLNYSRSHNTDPNNQMTINAEISRLNMEMAQVQKHSDDIINRLQTEINNIQRQMDDLSSMAGRVESMA